MRFPLLLERVGLIGRNGLFLVTSIDHQAGRVELAPLRYGELILENVPLHAIEFLSELPISPLHRAGDSAEHVEVQHMIPPPG